MVRPLITRVVALLGIAAFVWGCPQSATVTDAAPTADRDTVLDVPAAQDLAVDVAEDRARPDAGDAVVAEDRARLDVGDAVDAVDATLDGGFDAVVDAPMIDVVGDRCPRILPAPPPPPLDGALSCAAGNTRCGVSCVDLRTDVVNCGACGNACAVGFACSDGRCVCRCTGGGTCCTDACSGAALCANLASTDDHCGACFHRCAAGQRCREGVCVAPLACAAVDEPDEPAGVCDGRGMIACATWGAELAGGDGGTSLTVCVRSPAGCARADSCVNAGDPSSCRCGAGPACGRGQLCVATDGGVPECRCIRPL